MSVFQRRLASSISALLRSFERRIDKIENVRRALRSDKVFDVIGRLLGNVSLREYMMNALTAEGEHRASQDIERAVNESTVRGIAEKQANVYGVAGEVAPRLRGMLTGAGP